MTLFLKKTITPMKPPVTSTQAQEIYLLMREGKSHTDLFKQGIFFEYSQVVSNEIQRLETEINVIMSDIENQPATQEELVALVSSEMLDVAVVVNDVRRYADWTPDDDPTWEVYSASFSIDELI